MTAEPAEGSLWPRPTKVDAGRERLDLSSGFSCATEIESHLVADLEALDLLRPDGIPIHASHCESRSEECYRLTIAPDEIRIEASAPPGLFYAGRTLLQWLAQPRPTRVVIEDEPSFARRGVMLDVSRDRVPRLDELARLIRRLANWKLNEVQLYMEHTFAYAKHELVWRNASPFTAPEIRELDGLCRDLHIRLVPNQQSFGHFHRWLKHPAYRYLAEHTEGIEHPFSFDREPFGLCATDPGTLEFLAELYDELLPCFSAGEFHVGMDEALDLGLGRSKETCDTRGRQIVFSEFAREVHRLVEARGRRMLYWADEVEGDAGLARSLPEDAIAMVWGYERGHDFVTKGKPFRDAGRELRICPGTSSWQSLGGRTENMLANQHEAIAAARTLGATGTLTCDWGDRGHLQPPCIAESGFAVSAGLAWNSATHLDNAQLETVLNRHVFRDSSDVLGGVVSGLGRIHELAGGTVLNGTALFFLLEFAHEAHPHERTQGLDREGLVAAELETASLRRRLADSKSNREDQAQISAELEWVLELMETAIALGAAREAAPDCAVHELSTASGIAARLQSSLDAYPALWLARSRPGGLQDSMAHLERPLRTLRHANSREPR